MRLKRIFFFIFYFLLLTLSFLFAQNAWIQTYAPFNADTYQTEDVIVCQDGGYVINGYYEIYDPPFYDEKWGFLIKTDSDGNLLWAKEDTVNFMSESESDAFVETDDGCFISAVSNMWGGTALIKRDSEGNREWVIDGADLYVDSMFKTNDSNILLGGRYNTFPTLRKITQEGEILWTQDYYLSGSGSGKVRSVIQTSDGGFAITGYTSGNGFDLFVLKTDADGDSLWCVTYDGFGDWDEGYCIIENSQNDIFVSGYLRGNNRIYYGVLIKFDSEGELIFILDEYSSNHFYCFFSMVDTITDNKIVGYGRDADGRALNFYNYNGESLWDTPLPLRANGIGDKSLQIIDNGFILCGKSWGWDIALVKTDSNGQVTAIDDEIIFLQDYKLSNYPNPFNPSTLIQFALPDDVKNPIVEIFNVKGQKINQLRITNYELGINEVVWNAEEFSSGLYLYRINSENYISETKKMTLIK
ncbi:MAG: T9SS type A sorting domain-containing protein [Armatimonadetes bacterium]|nr:T9SS type A sorting domain-containing protein [Armatimonadota bacterium]